MDRLVDIIDNNYESIYQVFQPVLNNNWTKQENIIYIAQLYYVMYHIKKIEKI